MMWDGVKNYFFFSVSKGKFLTSKGNNGPITATSVAAHPFKIWTGDEIGIADASGMCIWSLLDNNLFGSNLYDPDIVCRFCIEAHSDNIL